LNSYSYAEDNPIVKNDPTGRTSAIIPGQGLVYDYNGTNESVCCSAPSQNTTPNSVSAAPPPGTANGYLPPNSYNHYGTYWMPTSQTFLAPIGVTSLFNLTAGNTVSPINPLLNPLPIRPSAVPKLQQLSSQTGLSVQEILMRAAQSPNGAIDLHNDANINIYQSKPANGQLIRITTNPEGDAIISAGTNSINDVTSGVSNGRFIPDDPLLFLQMPITTDIILY
jgi:hypothetical protein